ncbi:MAG: Gfo/Idh/MocA family oxidoreductase [Pirellulales bacterium]|nr:Gfo/Idh/MocA family oxidoreductase [Pirellulales bacterium]
MSQPRSTRRTFLKTTAGLAAAVPYFWTSASAQEEAANDKLGVAAIGVGGRGSGIGQQAASLGNLVACADVHRQNAEKFAQPYGFRCDIYTDYRKVLDRKDVDVITCGTPDHWHIKIAIDAMEAGKDVYCEKPLTLTIAEGRKIIDAVKRTGRVFQVGTQQRSEFDGVFLKAVVLARSGRLGETLHAVSSVGGATSGGPFATQPVPEFLDWDFWLGQAPKVDYTPERIGWNFRWWFDYSGGQVTDWGVHHTDIALWALGGDATGPAEVEGKGEFPLGRELMLEYLLGKKPVCELANSYNVASSFDCTMVLPNGNTINLVSKQNELILEGEKGKIRVNRGSLTGKPVEEMSDADKKWLDEEVVKVYKGKQPGSHMGNFFECVKDRTQPISDVFTHVNSVNSCHMANIAMLLGRKVKWDSEKYAFVGDDEANALCGRKQREPWTI